MHPPQTIKNACIVLSIKVSPEYTFFIYSLHNFDHTVENSKCLIRSSVFNAALQANNIHRLKISIELNVPLQKYFPKKR